MDLASASASVLADEEPSVNSEDALTLTILKFIIPENSPLMQFIYEQGLLQLDLHNLFFLNISTIFETLLQYFDFEIIIQTEMKFAKFFASANEYLVFLNHFILYLLFDEAMLKFLPEIKMHLNYYCDEDEFIHYLFGTEKPLFGWDDLHSVNCDNFEALKLSIACFTEKEKQKITNEFELKLEILRKLVLFCKKNPMAYNRNMKIFCGLCTARVNQFDIVPYLKNYFKKNSLDVVESLFVSSNAKKE